MASTDDVVGWTRETDEMPTASFSAVQHRRANDRVGFPFAAPSRFVDLAKDGPVIDGLRSGGNGRYELRFRPILRGKPDLAFPCDAAGQVDLDSLSNDARNAYFYARTLVGCEFAAPVVAA
jgi:hypothetical protein